MVENHMGDLIQGDIGGKMQIEESWYSMVNDRNALEWLVLWCLAQDEPCISIGRGKELLGFLDMQQMRDFMNGHADVYKLMLRTRND